MVLHRRAFLLATLFGAVVVGGATARAESTTAPTSGDCNPFAFDPFGGFLGNLDSIFGVSPLVPPQTQAQPQPTSLADLLTLPLTAPEKTATRAKPRPKPIRQLAAVDGDDRRCRLAPSRALLRKYHRREHLSNVEFIYLIAPFAQRAEELTGVPASVTIAQAIQETGFGASAHGAGNNLFGIKGRGNAGSLYLLTQEYYNGSYVTIRAQFAAYRSLQDAIYAHARFVRTGYFRNTRNDKDHPAAFVGQIARDGYATDPHYASELDGLISTYHLHRFDDSKACAK